MTEYKVRYANVTRARRPNVTLIVDFDIDGEDLGELHAAAADVIRRIEGDGGGSRYAYAAGVRWRIEGAGGDEVEVKSEQSPSTTFTVQLTEMADAWDRYGVFPQAAATARSLRGWIESSNGDFAPPVDADAIAAAERRGAAERQRDIVRWLRSGGYEDAPKVIDSGEYLNHRDQWDDPEYDADN
jgi:hypothetical protein